MTAFAREEYQKSWGQICWELRSVNHRYLDISIRLPDEWRSLDFAVRKLVQSYLKRGKVDCTLHLQASYSNNSRLDINTALVEQLWKMIQTIDKITGNTTPPEALTVLRWPGVLETQTLDVDLVSQEVLQQLETALEQLVANRAREGAQLAALIEQRCEAIAQEVGQVRAELPVILEAQRERLHAKLAEIIEEVDKERLEQEIVFIAQKMDVAEELDRLEAHLIEVREVLSKGQSVGRRLDFLVQELHREANTLGAKSNHIKTSRSVVELKVLIEQMREQVQNIE
jgi:uncharacterized protein (TIGR00255 family)